MMLIAMNVHKTFADVGQPLKVLKGINLTLEGGELAALVGPSGAGKSTLLHILGGLDRPDEGTVIFDDEDVYALNDQKRSALRNQKIGFVFQFYHLLPEFTALENVFLPGAVRDSFGRKGELEKKARHLLDTVGLSERANHRPSQLSGGEQQRVAIARALMNDPKIIFCDEPTGNLDFRTGRGIIELLLKLNRDNRQSLLIVTHDNNISKQVPRVMHMQDGVLLTPG